MTSLSAEYIPVLGGTGTDYNTPLRPVVVLDNRLFYDKSRYLDVFSALVFIVNFIVSIAIGISGVVESNDFSNLGNRVQECESRLPVTSSPTPFRRRRDQAIDLSSPNSAIWDTFSKHPEIPAVIILILPILAALWLLAMTKFPRIVVWGTILFSASLWFAAAATYAALLGPVVARSIIIMCCIMGVLYIIVPLALHRQVDSSARHLKTASEILRKHPSVFPVTFLVKAIYMGYLTLYWLFVVNLGFVFDLDESTCELSSKRSENRIIYLSVSMIWLTAFSDGIRSVITSMVTGMHFFKQNEIPRRPALFALKISLTKSFGTIAVGSLITMIVDQLLEKARSNLSYFEPIGCFVKLLCWMLQEFFLTLTRFTLYTHAIAGHGFYSSGVVAFKTLKRNFLGAFVNDWIGNRIVHLGAYMMSLAIGFIVWAWVDSVNGVNTLNPVSDTLKNSALGPFEGWFFVFVIIFMILLRYPLGSILFVVFLSQFITGPFSFLASPFCALFCAAVANLIFTYFGDVILDALNTVFLCVAIARDNQVIPSGDSAEYFKLVMEQPPGNSVPLMQPWEIQQRQVQMVAIQPSMQQLQGGSVMYAEPVYHHHP